MGVPQEKGVSRATIGEATAESSRALHPACYVHILILGELKKGDGEELPGKNKPTMTSGRA